MGEDVFFHLISTEKISKDIPEDKLKEGYSLKPFLIGLQRQEWDKHVAEKKPDLSVYTLDMLYQQYGKGAMKIVEMIQDDPEKGVPLIEDDYFIPAEIHYILKYELAPRLIDVMCRRTEIAIKIHHSKQRIVAEKVADIMATFYSWNDKTKSNEIKHYMDYIRKTIWF